MLMSAMFVVCWTRCKLYVFALENSLTMLIPASCVRPYLTQLCCHTGKDGKQIPSKYDLIANILHEGKAGEGAYRAHVHRKSEDAWYEVDDLRVTDILSQMVALSEAYMQIYELKQVQ